MVTCSLFLCGASSFAVEPTEGNSSRAVRKDAIGRVPFNQLSPQIREQLRDVVENPSYFRRMPTQRIECDPQMFTFLVRRPEVMVNIWEIMGITKVSAKRLDPNSFFANDGVGTTCRCDLVYADTNLHIYYGDGAYDGSMAPREVTGRCVCILRSQPARDERGQEIVTGSMDVFLRMDNLGADLLTRSVGPFVSKTADYNFVETAKFIAQICRVCQSSPHAAYGLAMRLTNVDPQVRYEFASLAASLAGPVDYGLAEGYRAEPRGGLASGTPDASTYHLRDDLVRSTPESGVPSQAPPAAMRFSDKTPVVVDEPRRENWQAANPPAPASSALPAPSAIAPRKQLIFMRR